MAAFSDIAIQTIKSNIEDINRRLELDISGDSIGIAPMKTCLEISREPRKDALYSFNNILYGAPGTGKTYATAEIAVAIIENNKINMQDGADPDKRKDIIAKYKQYQKQGQIVFTTFHQNYTYEDFIQGIRPKRNVEDLSFYMKDGIFKSISDKALNDTSGNKYVLIIDEINRANISKVFGELITLIEEDKRWGEENETYVTLPSGEPFAVPNNLYIIGTMNSADKSISLIDAALRRRFVFIEKTPRLELVRDTDLKNVLDKINSKLVKDLESTDLLIGHAYFIKKSITDLCPIFNNSIIPLLYEYYYDDRMRVMNTLKTIVDSTRLNVEIVDEKFGRIRIVDKKDEDDLNE